MIYMPKVLRDFLGMSFFFWFKWTILNSITTLLSPSGIATLACK